MKLKDSHRLQPDALRKIKPVSSWKIKSTDEIILKTTKTPEPLIGQQRAVEAMDFGLAVNGRGYNIFVTGQPDSGRTTYTLEKLQALAKTFPAPDDWVYLYNFDKPEEPMAVSVKAGQGKKFSDALEELLKDLTNTISKAFEQAQYEDAKAQYVKEFQEKAGDIMDELKALAAKDKFSLKRTPQGFINVPLIKDKDEDGKSIIREMKPEEFDELDPKKQKRFMDKSEKISQRTLLAMREIRDMEKELREKLNKLEAEICRSAITPCMNEIREEYKKNVPLLKWLDKMADDVIENFSVFITASRDDNAEIDFSRYQANLFVSNDPENGAPVIWETNPTYYNLSGRVEYESHQGYLYTDFQKILAGAFHKANGGFLVIDAEKVLMNFMSWESIKRIMRTGEAAIENLGEQYGALPVASLRPSPIKMNLKIVMTGSPYIYELLQYYDPEFSKIFKIKASFDIDMPRTSENEEKMAQFIAEFIKRENLRPFDSSALSEIIEWSGREAEDQNLLSVEVGKLRELLTESNAWAEVSSSNSNSNKKSKKKTPVTRENVIKAIEHKNYRSGLYQEKLARAFKDGIIHIDTTGEAVGQINGLSVIDLNDYRFGHPSRITANVFMGQEGVVNIEREVKMTGPIHNKGLMILSSYLGRKYAQDMPLSLSAHITFEQNYSGIEGDSASSTELYCLLSALSGLPLNQGIAVTGSVDQFGTVQPIGGVNEKIEGFYEYCKISGLTGRQGVMIPESNKRHLMLNSEVIQAVRDGKFSIWSVNDIDEGIEILTGVSAGKPDKNGLYNKNSVHGLVRAKLKQMLSDTLRLEKKFGREPSKKKKAKAQKKSETKSENEQQ
ncbi:MAG: ATP-binding protein [Synergistales bacterium]|nr:ATP-binding protein [Synergistales bacterium]MDY6401361.1 ATP-binding protein [Synergistales bacterium]MDY6410021.1 ATP-binding protein [Synergistales bacterium]MDY6414995.1 ATP-binding protein [Synergistales bacterium]MDY6421783.1 ATP-binding protein [Synergistales bacterium]